MLAALAENLDEQVGAAVDHARMIGEVRNGVDHAEQLDDPLDLAEIAQHSCMTEEVDAGQARVEGFVEDYAFPSRIDHTKHISTRQLRAWLMNG